MTTATEIGPGKVAWVPGIYPGVPFADYLAIDAVSRTDVNVLIEEGVTAYLWARDNPKPSKKAMTLGTAAHAALFEPEVFAETYTRIETERRRSKEWNAAVAELDERTVPLKSAEHDAVLGMRDRAQRSKTVGPVLAGGTSPELTVVAEDPDTGLLRKCRLDGKWFRSASGIILPDLKTTEGQVTAEAFRKKIANENLHRQAAWYTRTVQLATMDDPSVSLKDDWWFCLVAVRQVAPYQCALHRISQEAMRTGEEECSRALRFIAAGRKFNSWPGEEDVVFTHDLPGWKKAWKASTNPGPERTVAEQIADGDTEPW